MTSPALLKYIKRAEAADSMVCVGLDADMSKIPQRFLDMEYPQYEFCRWIIDETHEYAAAYKPNTAFYEARGDAGLKELKMIMDYLSSKHPDIFTILDAKRADIGNTNGGYVKFAFDWLNADSITLHPYLGREALAPFLERKDRCSIILVRTSNPGSPEFQDLQVDGSPLWLHIAKKISAEWNAEGNIMMVVGATYPEEAAKIREAAGDIAFLIPGIGAQGGNLEETVKAARNSNGLGMIINSSRGIIFAEDPAYEAKKLRDEIRALR